MFSNREKVTVIADGLKITGSLASDGAIELHGEMDGDIHCTSLIVSEEGRITGTIEADQVIVDGCVEGPIEARSIVFRPTARVTGNVCHETLVVSRGAVFIGSSKQEMPSADSLEQEGLRNYDAFLRRIGAPPKGKKSNKPKTKTRKRGTSLGM